MPNSELHSQMLAAVKSSKVLTLHSTLEDVIKEAEKEAETKGLKIKPLHTDILITHTFAVFHHD